MVAEVLTRICFAVNSDRAKVSYKFKVNHCNEVYKQIDTRKLKSIARPLQ